MKSDTKCLRYSLCGRCGVHCLAREEVYTLSHQGSQAEKGPTDHPVQLLSNTQSSGQHSCPALACTPPGMGNSLCPKVGSFLSSFGNFLLMLLGLVPMSLSSLGIPHYWNKHVSSEREREKSTLCVNSYSLDPHEMDHSKTSLSSQASCSSSCSTLSHSSVPWAHLLCAEVHTLVYRHVQHGGCHGQGQGEVVGLVEAASEDCASIWRARGKRSLDPGCKDHFLKKPKGKSLAYNHTVN